MTPITESAACEPAPLSDAAPRTAPPLTRAVKLFYGSGSLAEAVVISSTTQFLMLYYNQVRGLPAGQVGLAIAYALLAHAASAGSVHAALAALLVLVALVLAAPMLQPRAWAWALAALLAAGAWALHRAGLSMVPLLLVPVAFVWLVAWVFARSLRRDRVPLILRIVSGIA